jgi:hypothetical protein
MINDEGPIQETKPMPFWMVCIVVITAVIIGLVFTYIFIPVEPIGNNEATQPIETIVQDVSNQSVSEFNCSDFVYDDKPIIYLYPTEEAIVDIRLGHHDKLTCIYPEYNNGWNVLAKPNGDLLDLNTGRYQYSLYYECINTVPFEITNTGFVVDGKDIVSFLEEKLAILGLSEREADEFIIYWLPKLESNKYNYIRFATYEEIEANMPLEIQPQPDSIIRVMMVYKGLDEPIEVEEQILGTSERTGFTVVEWGGSELKG